MQYFNKQLTSINDHSLSAEKSVNSACMSLNYEGLTAANHCLIQQWIVKWKSTLMFRIPNCYFFITALHGMQTRSSDENSVCPSVCLSNACIMTKRKKNRSRFLYRAKEDSAEFTETAPVGAKSPILSRYSLVAPQPYVTSSEKSPTTNRKSTTRFPMSPRCTVRCP